MTVMVIFYILIGVWLQAYAFVKTCGKVHLKCVHFTVYKFYFIKWTVNKYWTVVNYTHAITCLEWSMLMSVTYFEVHPQCKMDWWIDRGMTRWIDIW